jgi:hypothetical protein
MCSDSCCAPGQIPAHMKNVTLVPPEVSIHPLQGVDLHTCHQNISQKLSWNITTAHSSQARGSLLHAQQPNAIDHAQQVCRLHARCTTEPAVCAMPGGMCARTLGRALSCWTDRGMGRAMSSLPMLMWRGPVLGTAWVGPPTSTRPAG